MAKKHFCNHFTTLATIHCIRVREDGGTTSDTEKRNGKVIQVRIPSRQLGRDPSSVAAHTMSSEQNYLFINFYLM